MKILVIRLSSLGDVVLATPALRFLREKAPGARIVFLTKPAFAPLLKGHPAVDEVWSFEGNGTLARVRREGFDAVLDLHGGTKSRLLSLASGARTTRVEGYLWKRRARVWLPWLRMDSPPDVAVRGIAAAARLLGLDPAEASALPSLSPDPEALGWADTYLAEAGLKPGQKLLGISAGAAWATKRWSPGYFAQAMGLLADADKFRFLFVGDAKDRLLSDQAISYARKGKDLAINAAGVTDTARLAALISRCQAFLTNDSGPMHVATALGVPVVALFGPTVEFFGFFPRGPRDKVLQANLSCRPCSVHGGERCPIQTHACMEMLAPFDAARAVREALA
ncbi:MAG: glycosyltransferase family 9 protein [candidate division FCPU426 bacterium]